MNKPDEQDTTARILHERAVRLAREDASLREEGARVEVTGFRLGQELYAIESRYVREVVQLKKYTPLPGAPRFIAGIMSLRGRILSLVDFHYLTSVADEGERCVAKVIVLVDGEMEFGVITDEITGVASIFEHDITNHMQMIQGNHHKYVRGVTTEHLIILDGHRLLHDPALVVNQL